MPPGGGERTDAASLRARRSALDRWQSLPLVALLGVAILLLAGFAIAAQSERNYRAERLREAEVQARMLAAAVAEPLEFEDSAAARESVAALAANGEIAIGGVYDASGALVAGYGRGSARPAVLLARIGATPADRVSVRTPVVQRGRRLGTVVISTDLDTADRRLTRYGGIALLAVMGSLVVLVLGVAQAAMRRVNAALSTSNAQLRAEAAERAQAEAALRQAQKMQAVGQLTGGIAHDFNNLLTPITGGLEFILSRMADEGPVRAIAENALEAAKRGARLTGQLLAFSRVQRLSVSPVAVNAVIEGMRSLLAHSIGGTVAIRLDLDPADPRAMCDANQIENAILNLAINARDAMPSGGALTISTATADGPAGPDADGDRHVCIAVADDGAGMTPEVLARAAEPFFTTKGVGRGTGLGLAQVYGIAHQYGGLLTIDSKVGEGTTVRILLPEADAALAGPAAEADQPAEAPRPHRAAEILVVDDDDEVRTFVAGALEALGYRVRAAADGDTGLALLGEALPDLLLLDYAMPGMSGAEVATLARERFPGLPIVFVTGYAETAALEAALGPGTPVLHKPFGIDALVKTLDANLSGQP